MSLPHEPVVKKFFSNKIESSRSSWYDYLIKVARIFYSFDGQAYNRDALLEKFASMSTRDSEGRDAANFRDEFGAYGTYLGIYHLEQVNGNWTIVVSEAAKRFLCCDSPNASAFCRAQLALFQYPNGAGTVLSSSGSMTVQANSKNDTMRELQNGIRLNPLRLICEIVVAQVELNGIAINEVTIPYHTLFCMVNDDRINKSFNHDLKTILQVYGEYSVSPNQIHMNLDGLTNFKRNFHILERTHLFVRDSAFGLMVSHVNPQIAYECIKTISCIDAHCEAFDALGTNPTDNELKDLLCLPTWGQYYDAANLPEDVLIALGAVIDIPPADYEPDVCQEEVVVERVSGGTNTLLYGVPGAGKSWTIAREYCSDETRMERLVFHPDYTYSDFVGQIMPKVEEGSVSYRFVPGPFTKLLKRAYENPGIEFFLIIEEINRGNAPAIFGEVFQLLDRKAEPDASGYPVGTSEYGITNENVASIVYGDPDRLVRIPSNMSIIGTMNTSDQNVFTLDTAFQRRWNMRLIENTFEGHRFADKHILDTDVSWRQFCEAINREILKSNVRMTSSEDKRLGAFFISAADLVFNAAEDDENATEAVRIRARRDNRRFAEKVIKYLWDDAFKFNRENVFETNSFISLEQLIREFMDRRGNDRFRIFKEGMFNAIVDQADGTTIQ